MWERDTIPGFAEAYESERVDRALAFAGATELIAGIKCEPLTARRCEWLHAYSSSFLCGGERTLSRALQFLWIVSPNFHAGSEGLAEFLEAHKLENLEGLSDEIEEYLDRAFLDASPGADDKAYYAFSADLITAMAQDPFHWTMEKTLDTPVAIIFQLLKVRTRSHKGAVENRRSRATEDAWVHSLPIITEKTIEGVKAKIDEMRKQGYEMASCISPNAPPPRMDKDANGNPVEVIDTHLPVSFSCAMMKKEVI